MEKFNDLLENVDRKTRYLMDISSLSLKNVWIQINEVESHRNLSLVYIFFLNNNQKIDLNGK